MKITKRTLVALALTLSVTSVATVATVGATREDIKVNKDVVSQKAHYKKIKELKNNPKALDDYVSKLSTREIMEAAYEMSDDGTTAFEENGAMFTKELKQRWAKGLPIDDIEAMVQDKTNNDKYRQFLLDGAQGLSATNANNEADKERVGDLLVNVAADKTEKTDVRRFSLLKLRDVPKNAEKKLKQEKELSDLVEDQSAPAEVKGAALTAMYRTKHPDLKKVVENVIADADHQPGILVRHAVADGVKSGALKDVVKMKDVAEKATDSEVHETTVYSLGLIGGQEAVKAVVDLYGKHSKNEDICRYALTQNQATIIQMLDATQPRENILAALKGVQFAQLKIAQPNVQALTSSQDAQVQALATTVLNELQQIPESAIPKVNKWGN